MAARPANPGWGERRAAVGRRGEEIAAAYLVRQGYRVLERNWRGKIGELDLIVEREGVIAIVEVRTHEAADYDDPLASIRSRKIRQVARAAQEYVLRHPRIADREMRFDVVGVTLSGGGEPKVEHIPDAFELPGAL